MASWSRFGPQTATRSAPTTLASFSWILFFFLTCLSLSLVWSDVEAPSRWSFAMLPKRVAAPEKDRSSSPDRAHHCDPWRLSNSPSSWTPFRVRASTRTCRCLPVRLFNLSNYEQCPAPLSRQAGTWRISKPGCSSHDPPDRRQLLLPPSSISTPSGSLAPVEIDGGGGAEGEDENDPSSTSFYFLQLFGYLLLYADVRFWL